MKSSQKHASPEGAKLLSPGRNGVPGKPAFGLLGWVRPGERFGNVTSPVGATPSTLPEGRRAAKRSADTRRF